MVKNHLKRIAAPKTWLIGRKESKFITRPMPGPHALKHAIALSVALREVLKVAKSAKEAKKIIQHKDVFVDKRKRTDVKYPVGIMDIVEFPQLEEQYRILLDRKGRLIAVKADIKEAGTKLARIESKTKTDGGKTQLNLFDGRNITVDKDTYKTGDTIQLSLPDQKILNHFKFEKGALLLLVGGKHSGMIATIEDISQKKIVIKAAKDQKLETLKNHVFVVGKDKPALESIKKLA
ncbi:30S ribosomal protein S4e [Candidatus Woesearchaeota archaeon]|jgi:small subunit ribosomal protein S4e|nr:30S ribosomal protein S4e [Candidatus Woesearchaeota archaeon]